MLTCCRCRKNYDDSKIDKFIPVSKTKLMCDDCAAELEKLPSKCPVCGVYDGGGESTGFWLSYKSPWVSDKALIHVCPNCHALYFDSFHYALLDAAKR